MISIRVEVSCDGCGGQHEGAEPYQSVAHAREAVEKACWVTHKMCGKLFDFCKVCQRDGAERARGTSA